MSTCPKFFAACLLIALSDFVQAADAPRPAYAERAKAIAQALESQRTELDATYDFSRLTKAGLLPPILNNPNPENQLPCGFEPCRIQKLARPYCKSKAANDAADCDAVSWRDYLFKGLADADTSLTGRDAEARFMANLAELQADFRGMSLYVSLEARGLVKPVSTGSPRSLNPPESASTGRPLPRPLGRANFPGSDYCDMTVDQGTARPDTLQREAPRHADGFPGARWKPNERINHTHVASDALPTAYYVQPFDFSGLDIAAHNFFWEMSPQVALTKSDLIRADDEH